MCHEPWSSAPCSQVSVKLRRHLLESAVAPAPIRLSRSNLPNDLVRVLRANALPRASEPRPLSGLVVLRAWRPAEGGAGILQRGRPQIGDRALCLGVQLRLTPITGGFCCLPNEGYDVLPADTDSLGRATSSTFIFGEKARCDRPFRGRDRVRSDRVVLRRSRSASSMLRIVRSRCRRHGHQPVAVTTGAFRWAAAIPPSLGASP